MYPYDVIEEHNYLMHHGIKGQKWGVRRFQNEDNSLTPAGRIRYGSDSKENKKEQKRAADKEWAKAKKMYKDLGKTSVSRLLNAIKYDPDLHKNDPRFNPNRKTEAMNEQPDKKKKGGNI